MRAPPPAVVCGLFAVLALAGRAGTASCLQDPPARQALAALRDSLRAGAPLLAAPALLSTRIHSDAEGVALLRAAFVTLARKPSQGPAAQEALAAVEALVAVRPTWPEAWLGLGQSRVQLWRLRAIAREGALQPLGAGYLAGSVAALTRALALDPTFPDALQALLALPVGGSRRELRAALAASRRADWNTIAVPGLWLDRGRWESALGSPDSARVSYERFVALGGDTATGYFHLARELFRLGSRQRAIALYFAGAERASSEAAWNLYDSDIAWIASPEELARWREVPGPERAHWLLQFWRRRDVEGGLGDGERLAEHYRRLEFALTEYGLDSLGRSRRVMPATVDAPTDPSAVEGSSPADDGDETSPDPSAAGVWDRVLGAASPWPDYQPTQHMVDDRGVIYIRHGPPDQIAFYVGGPGVPPNVSWRYSVGDSNLVYHFLEADFDGKVGPTVLSALLPPYMMESRCGLDSRLCLLSMRRRLPPEQIVQQRQRGRDAIAYGTTTDSYGRTFEKSLGAQVQVLGLFDAGGAPSRSRIVVPWAVPVEQLSPVPVGAGVPGMLYSTRVDVIAYDPRSAARSEVDTTRSFRVEGALGREAYLTGVSELEVVPGHYLVSVAVSQGERGSRFLATEVEVPARTGELTLADLVVGRTRDPVRVRVGPSAVPANPLGRYQRGDTLEVAYEVVGMEPGASYDVRLSVLRSGRKGKPSIALSAIQVAEQAGGVFQRKLGLRDLKPGRYLLRLDIECRGCPGRVSRQVELSVVD